MEWVFALVAGALATAGVWLMLSRHLLSVVFGVALLGSAANMVVFASGRVVDGAPPLAPEGAAAPLPWAANALPQALVLTAIVIGFGLLVFALSLVLRAYMTFGTADSGRMRAAEPDAGGEG